MSILTVTHNAGFFSCATIRLIEIMKYFNIFKCLPDEVDSSAQFAFFKKSQEENVVPEFFSETDVILYHTKEVVATSEPGEISFGDYSKLNFEDIKPFVDKYFSPSARIRGIAERYESKYLIDFENTCAVFYRGNDKSKECEVTPYKDFIDKAREIKSANPEVRFLVQPDETEFLQAFTAEFPDCCFHFSETPHMRRKDSAIFYELPPEKKTEHGCCFLAAVITMAKCKHVINHSGNGGMWLALYRGSAKNVHQFRNKHIY